MQINCNTYKLSINLCLKVVRWLYSLYVLLTYCLLGNTARYRPMRDAHTASFAYL